MKQGFRLNDYGSNIILTVIDSSGVEFDLSTSIEKKYIFKKPDGILIEKDVSLYTDGFDGKLLYVVEQNLLDVTGVWEVQAFVSNPLGRWHSNITSFLVWENLP